MNAKRQTKPSIRLVMWMLSILFVVSVALSAGVTTLQRHSLQMRSRQPSQAITDCSGVCPDDTWGDNG